MRKFHRAALVAAVIGSASMFGAGSAFVYAYGGGDTGPGANVFECSQRSEVTHLTLQNGLLNGPLLGSGPAKATAAQQICSGRDSSV
ncbi:hypothetical protein ACWFQ8_33415 [Streptomyces sp. NPDC055254]